jgi:hypothetical protein
VNTPFRIDWLYEKGSPDLVLKIVKLETFEDSLRANPPDKGHTISGGTQDQRAD